MIKQMLYLGHTMPMHGGQRSISTGTTGGKLDSQLTGTAAMDHPMIVRRRKHRKSRFCLAILKEGKLGDCSLTLFWTYRGFIGDAPLLKNYYL